MKSDCRHLQPVIVAAAAASLFVFACGLGHRMLAAQLHAPTNERPIDPAILKQFPLQIGDWTGQDVPLDERIVQRTGTDAHINRSYSRLDGVESVSLYVACGVDAHHLMSHRPETCYIATGFLMNRRPTELPLSDGTKLPCTIFQFSRGGLDAKKMTVLNYFIVDGEYCGDVSLLKSKAWGNFRAVGYAVQVQIVASNESLSDDSGMRLARRFAADSTSAMGEMVNAIENSRETDSLRGHHGEGNPL